MMLATKLQVLRAGLLMAVTIGLLLAAACTGPTPEPTLVIRDRAVPVAVSCVPANAPTATPDLAAAKARIKAAKEPGELQLALASGWLVATNFIDQIWPVVEGCRRLNDSTKASIP